MSAQLSVALQVARLYINDTGGNVFPITPSDTMIPFAQQAHREMQAKLWEVGSPVVRAQSAVLPVAIGQTDLSSSSGYPTDILTPFRVVEFATNATLSTAVDMTEVAFIPTEAQQTSLNYWCWIDEDIELLGATTARNVVIYYRRQIPIPTAPTDPIGVLFGEIYLASAIAAKMHGTLGNKEAWIAYSADAKANFQVVVDNQRGQQSPRSRP